MTSDDETKNKSSAEKKPIAQQAEGDAGNSPNNVVAPSAGPLAGPPYPGQEAVGDQQQPRLLQTSFGVQDQLGGWHTLAPPPPPPPFQAASCGSSRGNEGSIGVVPVALLGAVTGGAHVGGGGEGAASGAEIVFEAPSGPSRPLKRKSEVVAPPGIRPICSVCLRYFYSWKALFGHMRSHPERQWRGCFPPPISHPQPQPRPQQVVLALLAGETNAEAGGGGQAGGAPRGLDVDLNQPEGPPAVDFGAEGSPLGRSKKDGGPLTDIDINKTPPSEDEDAA